MGKQMHSGDELENKVELFLFFKFVAQSNVPRGAESSLERPARQ